VTESAAPAPEIGGRVTSKARQTRQSRPIPFTELAYLHYEWRSALEATGFRERCSQDTLTSLGQGAGQTDPAAPETVLGR